MSANRLTVVIGNRERNISSDELRLLHSAGVIQTNREGHIDWVGKRKVRLLRPELKLRGLSCKLGEFLSTAIENKEFWALLMRLQMRINRPHKAEKQREWHFNGIRAAGGPVVQYQP